MQTCFDPPSWESAQQFTLTKQLDCTELPETCTLTKHTLLTQIEKVSLSEQEYHSAHFDVKSNFLGRIVTVKKTVSGVQKIKLQLDKTFSDTMLDIKILIGGYMIKLMSVAAQKGVVDVCSEVIPVSVLKNADVVVQIACPDQKVFSCARLIVDKLFWHPALNHAQKFYVKQWDMHVVDGNVVMARLFQ